VNKQILTTIVRGNETVALVRIKPLNCSCTHNLNLSFTW
jgi:hypothetical protein